MSKKIGLTVYGSAGYGAKELFRLCEGHQEIEIQEVISKNQPDTKLGEIHGNLSKFHNIKTVDRVNFDKLAQNERRFIVLCTPPTVSAQAVAELENEALKSDVKIVDLSGCFRLDNKKSRSQFYPESTDLEDTTHDSFTYGLPELNLEKIKKAQNISNPGCYATAAILSIHPIRSSGISSIVVDGKSGSSGGGKTLGKKFHHPELNGNCFAYKVGNHRHQPEISEKSQLTDIPLIFCPHVIPLSRGMMTTTYVQLKAPLSKSEVNEMFFNAYRDSPFIRIKKDPPEIRNVAGSNFCDIHFEVIDTTIIVTAAIDNLVKGMAGQAIQNINLMSGIDQTTGLLSPGLGLV